MWHQQLALVLTSARSHKVLCSAFLFHPPPCILKFSALPKVTFVKAYVAMSQTTNCAISGQPTLLQEPAPQSVWFNHGEVLKNGSWTPTDANTISFTISAIWNSINEHAETQRASAINYMILLAYLLSLWNLIRSYYAIAIWSKKSSKEKSIELLPPISSMTAILHNEKLLLSK